MDTVDSPARTTGQALDDKGVVLGEFGFPPRSFLWSSVYGAISVKEMFDWDQAFPQGLSNRSLVGSFSVHGEASRPFSFGGGEDLKMLPKLIEDPRLPAAATAVSENGIVVGWCETKRLTDTADVSRHAVIWRNGALIDIGAFGGKDSEAVAVNNAGIVAGYSLESPGYPARAFRWSEACGLERLPPLQEGFPTVASNINEAGSIVGFVESVIAGKGTFRFASVWSPENHLSVLPYVLLSKPGSDYAEALAINNKGQVVGQQRDVGGFRMHAILWEGGQGYALKDLIDHFPEGTRLDRAVAINNRGEILLNGFDQITTQFVAILLTPIVPASSVVEHPGERK